MRILTIILIFCFCCCESKLDAVQLKEKIIKNESAFEEFVSYFTSKIPDKNLIVTFGNVSRDRISLHYYMNHGNVDTIFGGESLKLHSPELDKALNALGWTYYTLDTLTKGIKSINCDFIRNTEWYGNPINIYDQPRGSTNSAYNVYPEGSVDTLSKLTTTAVGETSFLRRVFITTSGAL